MSTVLLSAQPASSTAADPVQFAARSSLRTRRAVVAEPGVLGEQELDRLYAEAALAPAAHPSRYIQSCLAVDFRTANEDAHFGPQATLRAQLPEPAPWVQAMVAAILESMSGARPPQQFARLMTRDLYGALTRRHAVAYRRSGAAGHHSSVLKVSICEPADGVAEASVVVHHESRIRAIALRISGVDGRWLITAFEVG